MPRSWRKSVNAKKKKKKDPCEAAIAVLREAGITGDELVRVWEDMRRAPRLNGDT